MQNLIVLGIIPGTDIQVGFLGWLAISAALVLLYFTAGRIIGHSRKVKQQLQQSINTNTALIGPITIDEVTA